MKAKVAICAVAIVASIVFVVNFESLGPSTLTLRSVTTESADMVRTDYFDDSGKLTVAVNVGYATVVKDLDRAGHPVFETYYDAHGDSTIAASGQFAVSNEWDGERNTLTSYLDEAGNPVVINAGYAFIARAFDESDNVVCEQYLGADGRPVCSWSGYSSIVRDYDELGQIVCERYLDVDGSLVSGSSGYAFVTKEYDAEGHVALERYYDVDGQPCANTSREWGKAYSYDDDGLRDEVISIGEDGLPVANSSGYSILKKTYYEDGSVDTESYYDADGQPVALASGQYAIKHQDGKTIKLDASGNEIFFSPVDFWKSSPWLVVVLGATLAILAACLPRKGKVAFAVVYVAFILGQTVFRGSGGAGLELVPFWSYCQFFSNYNLRLEIVDNIWLFVPLGSAAFGLVGKRLVLVVPLGLSVLIECTQLVFGLGLCEFDDVISNTLGGAIGMLIASCVVELKAWHVGRRLDSRCP